jgi:hypothetical protein
MLQTLLSEPAKLDDVAVFDFIRAILEKQLVSKPNAGSYLAKHILKYCLMDTTAHTRRKMVQNVSNEARHSSMSLTRIYLGH